jgi:hypothetical protein
MSKKRAGAAPRPAPPRRGRNRGGGAPWLLPVGVGAAVLIAFVVVLYLYARSGPAQPVPAAGGVATGQTIDGIQCQTTEQVVYHIHAHLAIFANNGLPRTVPRAIGIPNPQTSDGPDGPFVVSGTCFYWLHSHLADGVMHVESPTQRTYTLGNWFDIWGQPLSASQVGADKGAVFAYVNGQRYTGDPRAIPLTAHAVIQLDVGTDVAPRPYTFASGL